MTYEIIIENGKEVITYSGGVADGLKEYFFGTVREGYTKLGGPNWNALKQALWNNSALLGKAYMSCAAKPSNAAAIAFLVGALKDGETGTGTQNGLLKAWQMIDVAWTEAEKATVNGYLTDNNFTITV